MRIAGFSSMNDHTGGIKMFKNANDAIDWIHGARYKGLKNGLENTRALLKALGDPQNKFRCVHIAGTNGKGSTDVS